MNASKTLIFVCSGNTCRSPLAWAAWQALNNAPQNFRALSGGLWAQDGALAATHSIEIARDWGVDLSSHRARTLSRAQVSETDCIAVMTAEHAQSIRECFDFGGEIFLLGEFDESGHETLAQLDSTLDEKLDLGEQSPRELFTVRPRNADERAILDPFGGSREAYQSCAAQIQRGVRGLARHLKTHPLRQSLQVLADVIDSVQ